MINILRAATHQALCGGINVVRLLTLASLLLAMSACGVAPAGPVSDSGASLSFRVINRIPHSEQSFTQGLEFYRGDLYEGTGRKGQSRLRRLNPQTGELISEHVLAPELFGEGITVLQDRLYQLTWLAGICLVYDASSLEQVATFQYSGEGWGLQHMNGMLVMSDGSSYLKWRDPTTFRTIKKIQVRDGGVAVRGLNELEVAAGRLYANVLGSDRIAVIDPDSGALTGWLDVSALRTDMAEAAQRGQQTSDYGVLNGIAYRAESDSFFVTGKNWPFMYEISILEPYQ